VIELNHGCNGTRDELAARLKRPGESIDGLFRNKVQVIQAERGYRVSEDTIILTWFSRPGPDATVLDAGTGCGAIAFGLAVRHPSLVVVGLEIQESLADRARRGAVLNRLDSRVAIVRGDLRQADRFLRVHTFDAVVSNPPYHEPASGRISRSREKAWARHQLMMPMEDLFRVSARILKPDGGLFTIYPASRSNKVNAAMKGSGFDAARMLWIHPQQGSEPALVCLEAKREPLCPPLVQDHLYVYRGGKRSPEAEIILAGEEIVEPLDRTS
jgi:tRNA1Val (adenine37-N6)-methyltransferase